MEIRFIGPLGVVTGSCAWMRDTRRNWSFLVDCGMQQGEEGAQAWNARNWPFEPASIQFVILTHAHIDHCGLLPRLYKDGFKGKVYCTRETRDLAIISLNDAARHPGALHTEKDVRKIRWHEPTGSPLLGGTYHPLKQDLFLRLFRTGHILGAVSAAVYWGARGDDQRSIVFSGDIGPNVEDSENLPFLRHAMHPTSCDFAVVESTYGATVRLPEVKDPEARRARLRALLDRTREEQGVLVLPCFALGRTQDLLFDLHWIVAEDEARYGSLNYYIDSPAAARIHPVLHEGLARTESNGSNGKVRPLWLGKQMFGWFGLDDTDPDHTASLLELIAMTLGLANSSPAQTRFGNAIARAWRPIMQPVRDREAMLAEGLCRPAVLLTGSGTCDGGPAVAWLPTLLRSEATTLALTGHCSQSTVGGQLLGLANATVHERRRHTGILRWANGPSIAVAELRAQIEKLDGYSAHADQAGLLEWLFWKFGGKQCATAKTVFIQHGEDRQRDSLAIALQRRAVDLGLRAVTILPYSDQLWHDLDQDGRVVARAARNAELQAEIERLQRELERI